MIARTFLVTVTALLLLTDSPACAEESRPSGRIEGRILDFPRAAPFPRARIVSIELYPHDSPRRLADLNVDDDGRFAMDDVPSGKVRLNPVIELSPDSRAVTLPSALFLPATVRPGQTTHLALFGKGRPITGRVVLPAGVKPENARVTLQLLAPPIRSVARSDGRINHDPAWDVYAMLTARKLESGLDAQGRFRITGVREGNYRVTLSLPDQPRPVDAIFDATVTPGQIFVQHGKLTVPFMTDGGSAEPQDLGTLSFKHRPGSPLAVAARFAKYVRD